MKIGPYFLNTVYTGDALELTKEIPDNSIDMIFTDPEYDKLDHYSWLAKTAMRVLKPDSPCLVWCSQPALPDCQRAMEEEGLTYHYTLTFVAIGKAYRLFKYHIFPKTTPCLWMGKGASLPNRWIADTVVIHLSPKVTVYKWHKNQEPVLHWLEVFTQPGDVVLDPFTGGGVVPIVCKKLGRHYIAFEIDPKVAEDARRNVADIDYHAMGALF